MTHSPLDKFDPPHARGEFGAVRKYDIHTGVDLYCKPLSEVHAIEDGVVVAHGPFTGPDAGSPWWNHTHYVMVEGASGVVLYGELWPFVSTGELVYAGDALGVVLTVLRKDKGLPMTMLHMELYEPKTTKPVEWKLDEPQPATLRDITPLLQRKGVLHAVQPGILRADEGAAEGLRQSLSAKVPGQPNSRGAREG